MRRSVSWFSCMLVALIGGCSGSGGVGSRSIDGGDAGYRDGGLDGGFDPRLLPPLSCGDGIAQAALGEVCDDGNALSGDGCFDCQLESIPETCGDGVTEAGEECDDAGFSAACDIDCTLAICGDGVLNTLAGESCDDGNNASFDGCAAGCSNENLCGDGVCDPLEGEDCATCAADCPCVDGEPCVRDADCGAQLRCDEGAGACSITGGEGALLSGLSCPVYVLPADPAASFVDNPDGSRTVDGPVIIRTAAIDIPFPTTSLTWFPDGSIAATTVEMPEFDAAGDAFGAGVAFDRELAVVTGVVSGAAVAEQLDDGLLPIDRSYLQFRIIDESSYGVSVIGPSSDDPSAISATLDGQNVIFEEYVDPCEPLWVVFSETNFGWSTNGNLHLESPEPLWDGSAETIVGVDGHEFRSQPLDLLFFAIPLELDGTFLLDFDANDDGGILDSFAIDSILEGRLNFSIFDEVAANEDDFGLLTLGATGVSLPVEGALSVDTLGENFVLDFDAAAGESLGGALSASADASAGTMELLFRGESLNPWADTPLGPWLPENSSILDGYYRGPEDWGVRGARRLQFFPNHGGPGQDALIEMRITPAGPTFSATGDIDLGTVEVGGFPVSLGVVAMTFVYDFVEQEFCGTTSTSGAGVDCSIELCAPLDGDAFRVSAECTGGCSLHSECPGAWCNPVGICEPGKPNGGFCLNNDAECASGHCEGLACVECEIDTDCAAIGLPDHDCHAMGLGADFRCKEPCANNGDCTDLANYCTSAGFCEPDLELGELCDEASDCASDFCDGLLVDTCVECSRNSDCPGTDNRCDGVTFSCYDRCSRDDASGDADCDPGEYCDGSRCQPQLPLGGLPCSRPPYCETGACADGICQECASDIDCIAAGEVCDTRPLRYTCEIPCAADGECEAAEFCDLEDGGFCRPDRGLGAICGRDAQCEDGALFCTDVDGDAVELGFCRECAADTHCDDPNREYCDNRVIGSFQCKLRNPIDGDCERDGWCQEGLFCAWPYCQQCADNAHCTTPGEVCDNFPGVGSFTCIASCSDDDDCAANGTEFCNVAGLCVPDRGLGGDCIRDEQCLVNTFYCTPLLSCVECRVDEHCGDERCDLTTFSCVTSCQADTDCAAGEWCNALFDRCEPDKSQGESCLRSQQCQNDGDAQLVCADPLLLGGTCEECESDTDCDPGEVCEDRLGIGSFTCERGCAVDADCTADDPDTWCDTSLGADICVDRRPLKGGCPRDAACEEGLRCTSGPMDILDGTCELCVEDADCVQGAEYCDYGLGRPYTCEPLKGQGAGCREGQCRDPYVCTTELLSTCEECDSDDDCTAPGEVCDDAAFRSFTCMPGCTDDGDCDDSTSFCNESAGVCDPDRDIGALCDGDTMCMGACSTAIGGTCIACRDDSHCPVMGEVCDVDFLGTPTCRPPCQSHGDCSAERYCDGTHCLDDYELDALGCFEDAECLGSLVCTSDGFFPGYCEVCADDGDCGGSSVCDDFPIVGTFTCVAPCGDDADCDAVDGWCSDDILREGHCEPDFGAGEGPCIADREGTCFGALQCNDLLICVPCDGDEDCAGGDHCELDILAADPYTCVGDLGLNESCNRPAQCQSGNCVGVPALCRECDNANGGDAFCESQQSGTHCNANNECIPDLGEGETICTEHVECAGALLCVGGTCRECATVDGGADAYCEANWGADTHCNASDQCVADYTFGNGVCANDAECAGSLVCDGGICHDCNDNGDCGVDACLVTGRCGCVLNSDCVVGDRYCSGGSCVNKKSNGSSCSGGSQCSSGICSGNICRQCTTEANCSGGSPYCVNYSCVACLPSGRACVPLAGQCCSGSCSFATCD